MDARNEKSMMARLLLLRTLMLKREILWWLESFNNLKNLYPLGKPCHPATFIPSNPAIFLKLSNHHKVSRLSICFLKIGSLTYFITLSPFLST